MTTRRILIVGGSTRAAADSVRRAGAHPICADLFADLDLRQSADIIPVRQYPHSLPEDVKHVRADGWFYCGALENFPDIVAGIQAQNPNCGPLLGTRPDALRQVRDPVWLAEQLRNAPISMLEVRESSSPPEANGNWLQKPLAGAGGRSIRVWDGTATQIPFVEPHYFQRRITGVALSAVFFVESNAIEWLGGATELQSSVSSQAPSVFAYCGSCGPIHRIDISPEHDPNRNSALRFRCEIPSGTNLGPVRRMVRGKAVFQSSIQDQLNRIAQTLVNNAPGLRGLVGLDFRLNEGTVWLTEVNPRFTASMEVLELAMGRSLVFGRSNADVTRADQPPAAEILPKIVAKQILYARDRMTVGDFNHFVRSSNPWQIPTIADIPLPGSVIEAGWPICTVFGSGSNTDQVRQQLDDRIRSIQSLLSSS